MSFGISGRYFDGRSAQVQLVTLSVAADGCVRLEPTLGLAPIPLRSLVVQSRIAGLPAVIGFPDGGRFETDDHAAVAACFKAHHRSLDTLHRLESYWPAAIIATVVLFVLAGLAYVYVTPLGARLIAGFIPEVVAEGLGAHTLNELDRWVFSPSKLSAERQASLREGFVTLLPSLPAHRHAHLELRSGGWMDANAFALPGGTVVLTDELVALADHDDQILGVLLHELGHVAEDHAMQGLVHRTGLGFITLMLFGDVSQMGGLLVSIPVVLAETAYSREMETAADAYAIQGLRKLGKQPAQLATLFTTMLLYDRHCRWAGSDEPKHTKPDSLFDFAKRHTPPPMNIAAVRSCLAEHQHEAATELPEPEGWGRYFSTHPGMAERIQRLLEP